MIISTEEAVFRLTNGDVVAIPTETVYGLAGRADSESAIRKIFQVKQRPFFDPLIIHVASVEQARILTNEWPAIAQVLAEKFWPGPLTMVLPKAANVSGLITSGLNTVALRIPQHPMALEILQKVGVPLAAPSANRFGHTSPTRASHVESEFEVGVVDGGASQIGLESTVLLIQKKSQISILREGAVTLSMIQAQLQKQKILFEFKEQVDKKNSPGHLRHHYMPEVPFVIVKTEPRDLKKLAVEIQKKIQDLPDVIEGVKIRKPKKIENIKLLQLSDDPVLAAREFYHQLRELSEQKPDILLFVLKTNMQEEVWSALWNRMSKAASLILDEDTPKAL